MSFCELQDQTFNLVSVHVYRSCMMHMFEAAFAEL